MKKAILSVLFFASLTGIGQNKYNDLSDACTRNAIGSGITNNNRIVQQSSFAINEYLFLNDNPFNFRRLGADFYYNPIAKAAFQTNLRGRIIDIQNCPNTAPSGVFPNAPVNTEIGIIGYFYGTDYDIIKNEIGGGSTKFDFYGKNNGQAYPSGTKNGNGYETVGFTSHSITSSNGFGGVVSKCRYKISDAQGNVVIFVEDSRGGFHPNYGNNLRGNNHPDDCNRYLPIGTYILEYSNTSDAPMAIPQRLKFWYQNESGAYYQIDETINKGETVSRPITISDTGTLPNAFFKLNNNFIN